MYKPLYNKYNDEIEIKKQWENFNTDKDVDKRIIPKFILESWERSRENKVNPNRLENIYLSEYEFKEEAIKYKSLVSEYGTIIEVIREIAKNKNWSVQIFDKYGKNLNCITETTDRNLHKIIAKDASEEAVGTNSIGLAIIEKEPIQIRGPEHYNEQLHDVYCSAAPILNKYNELVGVINIASINRKHNKETLSLVSSFAKVLTNEIIINEMNNELKIYNNTLDEMVKYYPEGILLIDSYNNIIKYNNKLLKILDIDPKKTKSIKKSIHNKLDELIRLFSKDVDNKDVILDINNNKVSLLITSREIKINDKEEKAKILTFKYTDEIFKINNIIKKKSAYYTFEDIVGDNNELNNIINIAKRIALTDVSILLMGESGTGKEVFAQAIHNNSRRSNNSFVPINCGAIPTELIESELFGYEPGSFTGGLKNGKIGKLEYASGGTVFLDEIDSMPMNLQIKLLRVLSSNTITRIGGKEEIEIDIRLISATKKDLFSEIQNNSFREDFYYRINTIILKIPPLRERKDDIRALTRHFTEYYARIYNYQNMEITEDYINTLRKYNFDGNVRELRHIVERSIILSKNNILDTVVLPDYVLKSNDGKDNHMNLINLNDVSLLDLSEKVLVEKVLIKERYNITKAAEKLGISRPTLYKKIKEYNLIESKTH